MNKKLVALPILVAILLSITGFAYAHWYDAIRINSTVEMGSFTLAFMELEPPVEYYWKDGVRYLGEPKGKDVGHPSSWLLEPVTDTHTDKSGYKKMHILIENAYPTYEVHSTFVVRNIGTIPLDITAMTIIDPTGYLTFTGKGTYDDPWVGRNPAGVAVINIWSINLLGEQLEPCTPEKAELDVYFRQEAEECHTYHFEVTYKCEQYDP